MHLVNLFVKKHRNKLFAYVPCTVNGWILCGIFKININRDFLFFKKVSAELTDNKKHIVATVIRCLLLGKLDNIVVISTCQAFIGCENKIRNRSVITLPVRTTVKICRTDLRGNIQNFCKAVLNHKEVRLCVF